MGTEKGKASGAAMARTRHDVFEDILTEHVTTVSWVCPSCRAMQLADGEDILATANFDSASVAVLVKCECAVGLSLMRMERAGPQALRGTVVYPASEPDFDVGLQHMPEKVAACLKEALQALNSGMLLAASAMTRATVEAVFLERGVKLDPAKAPTVRDDGRTPDYRKWVKAFIETHHDVGHIDKILEEIALRGDWAVHRQLAADREAVAGRLAAVVAIVNFYYVSTAQVWAAIEPK